MAKNVRISDELHALAKLESVLQDRSIAQQLEHWAKLGIAAAVHFPRLLERRSAKV